MRYFKSLILFKKKNRSHISFLFSRVQDHGGETIIPFSCALERNLADMPEDEAAKYCEENKGTKDIVKKGSNNKGLR
ncbi:Obg-like ATPase 1 [Vitis vinifera]|uniref:Obg-like ATPase 1 n=1 Tax=Vitis vinifera TaxID=29760 RepID=A0A438GS81_VITVI|nr:Obg-like ATPase 1 [Vitis vinifera]